MSETTADGRIFLLTGATGNIGGSVCRELISRGERVRALIRNPSKARVGKEVEISCGDILDITCLEKFFRTDEGIDVYVVHSAGLVTLEPEYDQKVHDVNVVGTQNIIDQCVKNKVKKLVYISSSSAIPELPDDTEMREVDHFDPDAVVGYYSKTKAMATQLVLDAVKQQDLDASVVFPAGIIGPNDYAMGEITRNILNIIHGKIPCAVEGTFNGVDVRDVSDAIIACCYKGRKGEGYILSSELITMRQFFDAVTEVSGCKKIKLTVPAGVMKAAVPVMEQAAKLTKKPPILNSYLVYNIVRNNRYSSEKAQRELDYKPRSMMESVRDAVAWLKEEDLI